jgi:hypothetical protein
MSHRWNGRISGVLLASVAGFAAGCSEEKTPSYNRVPTFPVKGQVLVDGAPANYLKVKLNSVGEAATPVDVSAFTDAEGKFMIGTYDGGDGAPAGEYKLTFEWGAINLFTGRYEGPDKLNGRYSDAAKSEFPLTVKEGNETDLGAITLTTK